MWESNSVRLPGLYRNQGTGRLTIRIRAGTLHGPNTGPIDKNQRSNSVGRIS